MELRETARKLVSKGILASDEGVECLWTRFEPKGIACTLDNRVALREGLFTTPKLNEYVSGVILFEDTWDHRSAVSGELFPQILMRQNVLIGITVDQGMHILPGTQDETVTFGLDSCFERCQRFRKLGASFAKFRTVVSSVFPSECAIRHQVMTLGRYARLAQDAGLVPIVEPEVNVWSAPTLADSARICRSLLADVFRELAVQNVDLSAIVLKPSMVLCTKDGTTPLDWAKATMEVLRATVPPGVPGVAFLSGAMSEDEATQTLHLMNCGVAPPVPWRVTFSFGRALQTSALVAWQKEGAGRTPKAIDALQRAFAERCRLNYEASIGVDVKLNRTLSNNGGFVFLEPMLVGRGLYTGRDIIAPNSDFQKHADNRGYVPVERWLFSVVTALNDKMLEGEGKSIIRLQHKSFLQLDAVRDRLLGAENSFRWPLVKLLDIGGGPIPCHVHSGFSCGDRLCGGGKLEAYHFPPHKLSPKDEAEAQAADPAVSPLAIVARLGLKPGTTREQVIQAVHKWGLGDDMYALCNVFPVGPGDGWTIRPGVVHSPAPWPTIEMQLPQDDFNMLAYKMGQRIEDDALRRHWRGVALLKGLPNCHHVVDQAVDMQLSSHQDFEKLFRRPQQLMQSGEWGSRHRVFFDEFHGESIQLSPNQSYVLEQCQKPRGIYVWSGHDGRINDQVLDCQNNSEVLTIPGCNNLTLKAGNDGLLLYIFYPLLTV